MAVLIVPLSQRLYDESHALLLTSLEQLKGYNEASSEVGEILKARQEVDGFQYDRIFITPAHQIGNAAKVNELFKKLDDIEIAFQNSSLSALTGNITSLAGDITLPATKVLSLAETYGHTWSTIKHNFLPLWNYYRAVTEIYVFSVFQSEYRVLLIFLNRPVTLDRIPEYFLDFAKSIGMELTSQVVPLTTMLDALLDLSATRLGREMQKIRQTDVSTRILLMSDHLFVLSNHLLTAESTLDFTLNFLVESESHFGAHIQEILKNIMKD